MSAAEILPAAPQKDRVLLRFEPTGDNGTPAKTDDPIFECHKAPSRAREADVVGVLP